MKIDQRRIGILVVGVLLGLLVMIQWVSYKKVAAVVARDTTADIFSELTILKNTNQGLRDEIGALEEQLEKSSNRYLAHQAILEEMEKYRLLTGAKAVQGPGIEINIDLRVEAIWLVDLMNDLWSAGAEAVAINGIRLTPEMLGFNTFLDRSGLGNLIVLQGHLIYPPYRVEVIGDSEVLEQALVQAGGMVARLKAAYPEIEVVVQGRELLEMESGI